MAGAIMRSTQFRSIVEPILNQAFDGVYNQRTDEYKQVFTEENGTPRSYHEEVVLYGFGAAPVLPDGQAVTYDEGGQLYVKRYTYDVYGLAFALTKVLVEDGDHVRVGSTYSKHLAQAMDETLETVTANHLNRAFTSGYNGGDGVSLVNASHPVVAGVQSNVLTSAALSQTSLEQAMIQIRQAVDPRGKKIRLTPKKLVIAPSNMLQAEVLLKSVLRAGTNNNDMNTLKNMNLDPVVISRLSSANAWFVQTDARDGMKVLWRRKLEKAMEGDFETDSVRYKSTMRFGSGWTEWRSMFGNAGV